MIVTSEIKFRVVCEDALSEDVQGLKEKLEICGWSEGSVDVHHLF